MLRHKGSQTLLKGSCVAVLDIRNSFIAFGLLYCSHIRNTLGLLYCSHITICIMLSANIRFFCIIVTIQQKKKKKIKQDMEFVDPKVKTWLVW